MKRIEQILVPTDLSESSMVGVGYALNLAKTLGAEVTVLHIVSYEDFLRYGEKLAEQIAKDPAFRAPDPFMREYETALQRFLLENFPELMPSVHVHEQVEVGDPDEKIVSQARNRNIDLIVISAHELKGIARFLRSNMTEKVTQKAPCPVLAIRLERTERKLQAA